MEAEKRANTGAGQPRRNHKDRRNRSKKQAKAKQAQKDTSSKSKKSTVVTEQPKKPVFQSTLPQVPVKRVNEPLESCKLCGEVIDVIASAMTHPEGGFCHFDCVLNAIAQESHLTENQKVSYIGRGTFAVVQTNEDGSFSFIKRIVWENPETFEQMKKYVEAAKV